MNEPLLGKNYPSTKHQNKFFIFRIRRHFPQCRSSRIYIYLFLVFVGVFVLFGLRKRTSFENCDEYSTNSARRIACKVFPGPRCCPSEKGTDHPESEEYDSNPLEEEIHVYDAILLGKNNIVENIVTPEPSIKTLTFAANVLNFNAKPETKIKSDNAFLNEHDKLGHTVQNELIHSTGGSNSNAALSNGKTNQSHNNSVAIILKKIVNIAGQTKTNELHNTKNYNTQKPITSDEISTQIGSPKVNNIIPTLMSNKTDALQENEDSKMNDVLQKGEDEEREQKTDKENYSIGDGRRELTLDEIKEKVSEINSLHTVYNSDKFRPLYDDSVIILIQVHKRLENLRELIKSLEKVRGIESTLLVFSHDYYDEDIINFVKEIQFAKFIIIFFPYAVQIHPNEFPGETPGDCPWDLSQLEAEKLKCNMYKHPDYYGHYRQGTITQIKHHWWWKAVSVFEDIEYTKHHKGLVLFLEEDLYVTEDVLHVITLMEEKTEEVCKNCSILFLGSYLEKNAFTNWIPNQVQVENWNSIGFTFNRPLWDQLKDCAEDFCTFDDYNWDWSVRYVFEKCLKNKPSALTVKGSRVFHTGDCGIHHTKKANCNIEDSMKPINNFMELIKGKLFPNQLDFIRSSFSTPKVAKKWGGWADPRDQYMCIKMVNHTLR